MKNVSLSAEKNRLLHFVIIGGGPTSVEFAAELHGAATLFVFTDKNQIF